ncbi:MAG: carboxypeptidase regulatory-like domain-containing protein [Fusobacteriaceae bacterium]|nr:carboxypeptidase regulatory-like domain-containing protein [Fusobacteriaceae bacterium]
MKKWIVLLFLTITAVMIPAKNEALQKSLQQDLTLTAVSLPDFLSVLSKEYHIALSCDESAGKIVLDVSFPKGTAIGDILDSLVSVHNLKRRDIGNTIMLSRKIKTPEGEVSLAGKVSAAGLKKGLEGVRVQVLKSHIEAVQTTVGGNFVVRDLTPGVYVVRFEKEGYVAKGEIVNLESSKTDLQITLESDGAYGGGNERNAGGNTASKAAVTVIDGQKYYTEQIRLVRMPAAQVKEIVESTYEGLLRATAVEKTNSVILFGKKEIVDTAKKVIRSLDSDVKQVRVSSQILDVSDNLFEELGFDWVFSNNGGLTDAAGTSGSLLKTAIVDGIGSNYSAGLGLVRQFHGGRDRLGVSLNLLQANQDLVISAMPSILITDGETGEFKIAEEVIVGESKDENDETGKTTYTPLFREAGIILNVQPFIQDDDTILLKVKIEVSNFKLKKENSSEETGTYNAEGGSKVGRSVVTTIRIRNGETIFIGGLKRAILHTLESKVPLLGDIPLLGVLFRKKSIKNETTDIYVKMKVDVLSGREEREEFVEVDRNFRKKLFDRSK